MLIDLFMSGAELRDPNRPAPLPLDFAVSDETRTLCLLSDWWTVDWGMDKGITVIGGALQEPGTFDGLNPELRIATPSDDFFQKLCDDARYRCDTNRAEYRRNLQRLVDFEPEFDFTPWLTALEERSQIDPLAEFRVRVTAMRSIGRIRLIDAAGVAVDTLVIDELGGSEVADPDGWLSLFAGEWSGYDDAVRPEVGAYMRFIATKRPPGAFALSTPEVFQDEGDLKAHTLRAVGAAPAT